MALDITANNTTKGADEVVNLTRRSAADCVSDTDAVNTLLVNSLVKAEKIDKVTLADELAIQLHIQSRILIGTYSE
jgi:hypothetical protein